VRNPVDMSKNFDPISDAESRFKVSKKEARHLLARAVEQRLKEMEEIDEQTTTFIKIHLGTQSIDTIVNAKYAKRAVVFKIMDVLKLNRWYKFDQKVPSEEVIKDFQERPKGVLDKEPAEPVVAAQVATQALPSTHKNTTKEQNIMTQKTSEVEKVAPEESKPCKENKYFKKNFLEHQEELEEEINPSVELGDTSVTDVVEPMLPTVVVTNEHDNFNDFYGPESNLLSVKDAEQLSATVSSIDLMIRLLKYGRTEVFIDASNLHESQRLLGGVMVDYLTLRNFFHKYSHDCSLNYYSISLSNRSYEQSGYDKYKPIHDWLKYNGYEFVTKFCIERTDERGVKTVKGNMDTYIVTDMIMSVTRDTKNVILFSGDGDFCYACSKLKAIGINVIVISPSAEYKITSRALRESASVFVPLENLTNLLGFKPIHNSRARGFHPDVNDPL